MLNEDGIIWKTRFSNTLFLKDKCWPNDTEVSIHMTPETDDVKNQHMSFEKYKYIFSKILQNSIFVENRNTKPIQKFNNNIIDFFNDPVDQIVGVCLLSKLNAVAGDHLHVDTLEIESWQGENLRFVISENSPEYDLLVNQNIKNPWWNDPSPRFGNIVYDSLTWNELGFKISDSEKSFRIIKGGQ